VKRLLGFLRRRHRPDIVAISAYLDGHLGAGETAAFVTHIEACDACRARLDELRAARTQLRALPPADTPRSFRLPRAMVDAPRGARPARRPLAGLPRFAPAVAAVAALAFGVLVAFDAYSSSTRPSERAAAPVAARRVDVQSPEGLTAPQASGAETRPAATPSALAPAPGGDAAGSPEAKEKGPGGTRGSIALRIAEGLAAALAAGATVFSLTQLRRKGGLP
jgi:anti-sigma factor RsiW